MFKADVLKKVIESKNTSIKIETMLDSETFKNPCGTDYLWEAFDIIISTIDEYHTIVSLLDKAIKLQVPIIIVDAPRLTITAHSMIPYIDTESDIQKYRHRLQQKLVEENYNLNSVILTFPSSANHCILWAKSIFTLFFTSFYYKLIDFSINPAKVIEDLENQPHSYGYELHIIDLVKFLYLQRVKREFGNCIDLATDFFMVEMYNLRICFTLIFKL